MTDLLKLAAALAAAVSLSGCIIVVDEDDEDDELDVAYAVEPAPTVVDAEDNAG